MVLEQLDIHMQKTMNIDTEYTFKKKLKMNNKINCKLKSYETPIKQLRENLGFGDDFSDTPKVQFM